MSYTDPFGGSTVQPSQVAFRAVALSADVTLSWPSVATDSNYVARLMYVTPSAAGFSLTMPDATAVSVGFDVLYINPGADSYTVKDNAGGTICTVPPGEVQYVYLRVNSTAAGTWGALQFASLASAVTAAALIGPGIGADGGALYASQLVTTFNAPYSVLKADRSKVFVWTGGVGTLTLPLATTAGDDFFISVCNQGTGALTVDCSGADTLDGDTSTILLLGESFELHSNGGTAWYSVGRGRNQQFNFTLLTKTITTGTYTLTTIEASNVVQIYSGVLVGNVNVVVPSTVQVYYVSNQTSGAFTVTFKTAGVGSTVTVPTGQNAVLFCDGLNLINASTTVSGLSSLILNPGAVSSPSLTYTGDTTTGLYQPTSGAIAATIAGVQRLLIDATGVVVNGKVQVSDGTVSAPSISFTSEPDTGIYNYTPQPNTIGFACGGALTATLNDAYFNSAAKLGSKVTIPRSWFASYGVAELGDKAAVSADASAVSVCWNTYTSAASVNRAKYAGVGSTAALDNSGFGVYVAPAVAADAVQTFSRVFAVTQGGETQVADGSVSLPSISFISDPTTGIYKYASAPFTLGFTCGGSFIATLNSDYFNAHSKLGSRVNVAVPWDSSAGVVDLKDHAALFATASSLQLRWNSYFNGVSNIAKFTGAGGIAQIDSTGFRVVSAPSVSGGAVQTFSETFVVEPDGRVYGKFLHNNAGSVTGTSNQYIASGTYTPTLTNASNISASTANVCNWQRIGNVVNVWGTLLVTPLGAGICQLGISLPIASTIASTNRLGGTAMSVGTTANAPATIAAAAASDRANVRWIEVDTNNRLMTFNFGYEVV